MQSHLGSVVWCLDDITWLGLKFLEFLRDFVGKDVQSTQSVKLTS
jgi:hypothetical protein